MSAPAVRFQGALGALAPEERALLLAPPAACDASLPARVAALITRVRRDGDRALFEMARELDGVELDALEVPRALRQRALAAQPAALSRAMERAIENLTTAHRAQLPLESEVETESGVVVGRRPEPLGRVGLYAPGGRARYPSSVLMGTVPARVAGVGEILLCSPPGRDGLPTGPVLAAAELAGVDRVFAIGGAGAIAAMACGTASVPAVEGIVGPGNAWVAEAKLQVTGRVAIDAPAGPSELLVIANGDADPAAVAREMVAQAEHDPDARVVAVAVGAATAERIAAALPFAVAQQPRRAIVAQALARHGGVLWARDRDEAIDFANEYAPEHLLLALAEPRAALARVRCAGTVCLGLSSAVVFGDYLTGANHVLPTGGHARSCSGLSTAQFVRWTTWQEVTPEAAARLADDVAVFADAEELPGHAAAARAWKSSGAGPDPPSPPRAPLDLSDNTNLFGAPPAALRALRGLSGARVARYPDAWSEPLKAALARYAGVSAEEVVTGCGSDDLLDAAFRALAQPGEAVAFPDPTFSMIPEFARLNRLAAAPVPLTPDLDIDAGALLATGAPLIYLCSPNNPTGAPASPGAIARVLEHAPGNVVLDQAYAEFAGSSSMAEAPARGNVLMVRTLSKAFGLAGLRVGYAIGAAELVHQVERARGPYKVSVAAERAACAALSEDLAWVRARADETVRSRDRFAAALAAKGIRALPSAANFVLVPIADARAAASALGREGVKVRAFTGLTGIGDALRISIGPWPMMESALEPLARALA